MASQYGEVALKVRDGVEIVQLKCPGCGKWGDLDYDQLHGRVSVECGQPGCSYHETHDFGAALLVDREVA